MPYQTDSEPRRAVGPAIASVVAGVILGGALAFGAGAMADNTELPNESELAVNEDNAFLGSVQYGGRVSDQ
ncbi:MULTISPECIES: DUF2613 domain-containing protein [Corynebacterium]|uniref:DUF2613 domain-containing protein n=1 Tax=Corynebacterium TaxID=1716 RepID=UPI0008A32AB7|nr:MULTISPECIES: DUF2613 domain-containing protein [Corynebacterium]MCX2163882.1 DUF2613 domain-containing protein [Corynebacterium auriscanis]OFT87579.1 hypothetical protein HMPREF3098_09565 [Corynebacterium sp. HMSC28B08]